MKVGTDAVLLGAWVEVASCRRILDAGAGAGLISLMMAQRNEQALIDGVEIDPQACRQAADNVAASPFAQQIRMYPCDFHDFARTTDQRYDLIVSNPPYFTNSLKCPDHKRSLARHNDLLSLDSLLRHSLPLLQPDGRIALILPCLQQNELHRATSLHGLHCIRQTTVHSVLHAVPKRILVELSLPASPATAPSLDSLILEDAQHHRSPAYSALTQDFYL
jgi:tRNA1Val (adenine37-N6)-methyltransferase